MAYPTAESNDREGGSPSKAESEKTSDYMASTEFIEDNDHDADDRGPYVDRKHPHQESDDRKPGAHPHQDLAKKY